MVIDTKLNKNQFKTIELKWHNFILKFFKDFIYFLERGEGREKERERNINVWLPLMGLQPATQARALTGN